MRQGEWVGQVPRHPLGEIRGAAPVVARRVNTAARVESATRQTDDDVLITETTLRLLAGEHGGWDARHRSR
jgi:class 3 adenylate cyclase